MKTATINALKAKFEGVSDAIIGRVAEKLISSGKVKNTEDVANAVAGVTFQQVLENYGDSRADEAQKTAVKNYENKYKIKDGQPVNGGNGEDQSGSAVEGKGVATGNVTKPHDEEVPAWAQALIDANKRMAERLDGIDREKTANSRQSQLAEILKNAPQSVRSRYEKDFSRMTFKDDEEFTGWLTELTPDIEQISADLSAKGGMVGRPKGGSHTGANNTEVNPYVKARIEARAKAETSAPAIQGLTTNQ